MNEGPKHVVIGQNKNNYKHQLHRQPSHTNKNNGNQCYFSEENRFQNA
jgi:hypothetical protein